MLICVEHNNNQQDRKKCSNAQETQHHGPGLGRIRLGVVLHLSTVIHRNSKHNNTAGIVLENIH